jgi:hypothetical protein
MDFAEAGEGKKDDVMFEDETFEGTCLIKAF